MRKLHKIFFLGALIGTIGLTSCNVNKPNIPPFNPEENLNDTNEKVYQIYKKAVEDGEFEGTYEEWLDSIKGDKGDKGEDGKTPYIGENGNWWIGETDTKVSATGGNQKSNYELYKEIHPEYEGTEEDFIHDLINGHLKEKITVSYYIDNKLYKKVDTLYNSNLLPPLTYKKGYYLDAWLENGKPYDFSKKIKKDLKLYASFKEVKPIEKHNFKGVFKTNLVMTPTTDNPLNDKIKHDTNDTLAYEISDLKDNLYFHFKYTDTNLSSNDSELLIKRENDHYFVKHNYSKDGVRLYSDDEVFKEVSSYLKNLKLPYFKYEINTSFSNFPEYVNKNFMDDRYSYNSLIEKSYFTKYQKNHIEANLNTIIYPFTTNFTSDKNKEYVASLSLDINDERNIASYLLTFNNPIGAYLGYGSDDSSVTGTVSFNMDYSEFSKLNDIKTNPIKAKTSISNTLAEYEIYYSLNSNLKDAKIIHSLDDLEVGAYLYGKIKDGSSDVIDSASLDSCDLRLDNKSFKCKLLKENKIYLKCKRDYFTPKVYCDFEEFKKYPQYFNPSARFMPYYFQVYNGVAINYMYSRADDYGGFRAIYDGSHGYVGIGTETSNVKDGALDHIKFKVTKHSNNEVSYAEPYIYTPDRYGNPYILFGINYIEQDDLTIELIVN